MMDLVFCRFLTSSAQFTSQVQVIYFHQVSIEGPLHTQVKVIGTKRLGELISPRVFVR